MSAWWQALPLEMQVFYGVAIVSTTVLVFQTLLMLIGLGDDLHVGDVDVSPAGSHLAGLHVLSVRTIVAFLAGFGWTGIAVHEAGGSLPVAIAAGLAVGFVLMYSVVYLMRTLTGLGSSGTLDYRNAIGQIGSVYLPIPAKLAGNGQIEVMVQGRLMVVHACTRGDQAFANQAKVKVVDLLDQTTLLVEAAV
jgi:hypothetical protein